MKSWSQGDQWRFVVQVSHPVHLNLLFFSNSISNLQLSSLANNGLGMEDSDKT